MKYYKKDLEVTYNTVFPLQVKFLSFLKECYYIIKLDLFSFFLSFFPEGIHSSRVDVIIYLYFDISSALSVALSNQEINKKGPEAG